MGATTTTPVVEHVDVTWDNRVHVRARFTPGKDKDDIEVFDDFYPIPEEHMVKAQELVGDGLASITTGAELKNSDYGTGASCFVSVKLTCGQDEESIFAAGALAREIAMHQATEGLNLADQAMEDWLAEQAAKAKEKEAAPSQPAEVKKDPPAKRVAPKTAGAKRPRPKARPTKAKPAAASGKTRVASASTSGNAPKVSRLGAGSNRPKPRAQKKR